MIRGPVIDLFFCGFLECLEGHEILTSAKVQRSETFADVDVFKLSYGPLLRLQFETFCRCFVTGQ